MGAALLFIGTVIWLSWRDVKTLYKGVFSYKVRGVDSGIQLRGKEVAVGGGSTVFARIEHRYRYLSLSLPAFFTFEVNSHRFIPQWRTKVEASRSKTEEQTLHSINTDNGRKGQMKSNADVMLASINLWTLCYSVRISHDKWQGSITREAWNKLSPVNSESMLRALPIIGFYKAIL